MSAAWDEQWGGETKSQRWAQQPPPTKEWKDDELVVVPADYANEYVMADGVLGKWPSGGNGKGHGGDKGGGKGGYKGGGKGGGQGGDNGGDKGGGKRGGKGGGKGNGDGAGDGAGDGGGKGQGGKGKLRIGSYEPLRGTVLYFHPSKDHAFYDSFPAGYLVDAAWFQIDLDKPFLVEQTMSKALDTDHHWWGRRKQQFVSVSFKTGSGHIVWTNFSRNGVLWMRIS